MDDPQNQHEILEGVIREIQKMRAEMRASKKETDELEAEVETMRATGTVTEMGYAIYRERLRRSREDISFMMRKLDRERKRALQRLFELDNEA